MLAFTFIRKMQMQKHLITLIISGLFAATAFAADVPAAAKAAPAPVAVAAPAAAKAAPAAKAVKAKKAKAKKVKHARHGKKVAAKVKA
jgi:hypothetical protein